MPPLPNSSDIEMARWLLHNEAVGRSPSYLTLAVELLRMKGLNPERDMVEFVADGNLDILICSVLNIDVDEPPDVEF